MRKFLSFAAFKIVFLFLSLYAIGQNKYWVYLIDKGPNCPPTHFYDQSIYPFYSDSLKTWSGLSGHSRWLNAVCMELTHPQLQQIQALGFVTEIKPAYQMEVSSSDAAALAPDASRVSMALHQMDGLAFHHFGYRGQGVKVGIIDGGFYKADQQESLREAVLRIKAFRDYVTPSNTNPFYGRESMLDSHGTTVWQMVAGYNAKDDIHFGLAQEADFYLARTDHGKKEFRAEEMYLIQALEWMDSLGVRLINISLGYALKFDDPSENHHPSEVDGKSSAITRAVQIAVQERGITIINSAGNEGNDKKWRVLSLPADAPAGIAVGATGFPLPIKAGYSSIGPEWMEEIKPDVACYSASGTSFSAPVITGLIACMMQMDSTLSPTEIKQRLIESSTTYAYPNNYIGYGVPNAIRLISNFKTPYLSEKKTAIELKIKTKLWVLEGFESAVVFHKKDGRIVLSQENRKVKKGVIKIQRPTDAQRSTVITEGQVVELFWE